jgi:ribonuclease-3
LNGFTTTAMLDELQTRLGYQFQDAALLQLALTHPSVRHESGAMSEHNQRLEFLGDSVLELVLTAELYARFPALGEGPLTKARAQMVNRRALAEHGRRLGVGECLLLSRGEDKHGGRDRASILADAFEALIGAVFLDGGFAEARTVVIGLFGERFEAHQTAPLIDNPKGELQEILQATSTESPKYVLRSATGPDHDRNFECAVFNHGVELGHGRGKSKKDAESDAALAALANLRVQAGPPPE